jgi:O-antigen ligase
MQYNRLEGGKGRFHTHQIRNPHQEFLLWMVELGVLGLLVFSAVFFAAARDAKQMTPGSQRAVISVLIAMLVSCIFNSALYDAQIGDYLCVALGLALALGAADRRATTANGEAA